MTTQPNKKIRLVRCPKCTVVLPEPDIPVYKCGGCGAVLQAKARKSSTTSSRDGEAAVSARGESSLSDSSSNRNEESQGATVFARGELLSDSSSNRNDDNVLLRQEALSDSSSNRILQEAAVVARKELSSDSGSDNGVNLEATVVAREEPSSDSGFSDSNRETTDPRQESNGLNEEASSETGGAVMPAVTKVSSDRENQEPTPRMELRNNSFISGRTFSDDFFSSREFQETEDSSPELEQIPQEKVSSLRPPKAPVENQGSFVYTRKEGSVDPAESDDQPFVGKLGFKDRELSKSPTKRYYGHDGGESSYDGFKERIASRSAKPPRRKFKQANGSHANGSHTNNLGAGLNGMLSDESDVRTHQARKPPMMPEKYRTNDYLHNPRIFSNNIRRAEVEDRNSNFVYLQTGQRKANSSYPEPGKMELLRVVNELKEELKRMHISNTRFPLTATREENYNPLYHEYLTPVEETSYPRNHPRIAFSGDAADYTRHVDCGCRQCLPPDRHFSAQLPSHTYLSSEYSAWDQWSRDNAIRNMQMRERFQFQKRRVLPVAGGNPIISCYQCSELLHLPADFIVTGRRCHKLRCHACRKVLKFSLRSGKHIVPWVPDADVISPPPPSMADGSISRRFHREVEPEPFSYDEYGISFDRSISTEAEVHHVRKNNSRTRKMSEDAVMSLKDRKMKSKEVEEHGGGGSPLHRLMGYPSPSAVMRF